MTNVLDVAKYISQLYKQLFNEAIDEMKLHKLLYYSQRQCLTEFNKPLFNDNFEAWAYGPVIPIVRNNLQEIISNKEKINFEEKEQKSIPKFKVKSKASKLLRKFILAGGFDIDENIST